MTMLGPQTPDAGAHIACIALQGVPNMIVKVAPHCTRTAVALPAALLHCMDDFRFLLTVTPMSFSSSVVLSFIPLIKYS